jgi:hypothetical protein
VPNDDTKRNGNSLGNAINTTAPISHTSRNLTASRIMVSIFHFFFLRIHDGSTHEARQ